MPLSNAGIRGFAHPVAVLLLTVTLLFLAACGGGGSSDPKPLGKAEFISQANAICRTAEKERGEATKLASSESKGGSSEEAQAFTAAVLAPVTKMTEELAELGVPKGDAKQVEAIVSALEASIAQLEGAPLGSGSATTFAEPDKLASAYGLTDCTI